MFPAMLCRVLCRAVCCVLSFILCCSNWATACPNIKAAIKKLDKLLRRVKVS